MIYDITQEIFSGECWPGDMRPEYRRVRSMDAGDRSNTTEFSMNAHNATHIDAPKHRIKDGKAIDELDLEACFGECEVICYGNRERLDNTDAKRIIFKDTKSLDAATAQLLVDKGVIFVGAEGVSIGDRDVHNILLGAGVVVLEAAAMSEVPEGKYFLSAAPIKLGGSDGAPVRAVLIAR